MLRFHEFFNQDSCFFNFYCFFVKTICEKSKFIFVLESWKHTSYLIQRSWLWNRKLQYLGTKLVTLYFLLRIFVNFDVHCDFESNFRILKICDLFTSEILRLAPGQLSLAQLSTQQKTIARKISWAWKSQVESHLRLEVKFFLQSWWKSSVDFIKRKALS